MLDGIAVALPRKSKMVDRRGKYVYERSGKRKIVTDTETLADERPRRVDGSWFSFANEYACIKVQRRAGAREL